MASNAEQYRRTWRRYELEHDHAPASAREAVEWGVSRGLIELPKTDPYDVLAGEMAKALRQEYATDPQGRRYRVNHAIRVSKSGVQMTFWAMMDHAPRSHMEKAFTQRRENIVGECCQLKTDMDVYNDANSDQPSLPLILDFTDDVAERQHSLPDTDDFTEDVAAAA